MRGLFFVVYFFAANPCSHKDKILARTNYSYEKRQKELAKKKKKEEKKLRKLEKKNNPDAENETLSSQEEE
jgi:hypothetical protein